MARREKSLFTSFLQALEVPCTGDYSDRRFATMPFRSLFGLTRLLGEYGIESRGLQLADKSRIVALKAPFMAQTADSFVVVTAVGQASVDFVDDEGVGQSLPTGDFIGRWTGVVLQAFPCDGSCEPDYERHRLTAAGRRVMRALFWPVALLLIGLALAIDGGWRSGAVLMGVVVSAAGLGVSYLLVLKQLGVKSHVAERVCGVVQAGGCDDVLATEASKFFGLFGWSEVGVAYFSVTLGALLLFPASEPTVAVFNILCLPFSFWSVWYQRYRARAWCTLCLTVQGLLWLLMLTQLCASWWHTVDIFSLPTAALGASYLFALLCVNRLVNFIKQS